jgi:hypothetical protein
VIQIYGRVHGDPFNVTQVLRPGVQLHVNFTKVKNDFYMQSAKSGAATYLKFLDATLHVRHVKPSPTIQLAQTKSLETVNAR